MHRLLTLILLIPVASLMYGQSNSDEYFSHKRASVTGALTSSETYQLQFAYHYMFGKYFGIGGSIGWWKNWSEDGKASGSNWVIDNDDNRPGNFFLRPSAILKSPAIDIREIALSLYAEPGVMCNIPYRRVCIDKITGLIVTDYEYISTNKGQWLALDIHLGVNADIGPCGFSIGYMMSNLDIYSQHRHLSYNGVDFSRFYPKHNFMQGAYLTLSYNF